MSLTSRERVVTALNHEEPDRVPIAFGGLHDSVHLFAHRKLKEYLDLEGGEEKIQDPFQQIVFPDKRLVENFNGDTIPVYANPPDFFSLEYKDEGEFYTYTDEWGTKYKKPKKSGLYYDFAEHIFTDKSIKEIKEHSFPDPVAPGRFCGLREEVEEIYNDTDKAIVAYSPSAGIFESTYWLRGMEETYMDMVNNLELLEVLTGRILEWKLAFWEAYLKEIGDLIQVVQIGDDLGGQDGPIFSPEIYRKLYKPKHRKLISLINKYTDAKVYFHSCGSIYEYLPDLIEVGVEIINPVQFNAARMEPEKLKKEFGEDLVFWGGGCNPQGTLASGTPQDVREEVKQRLDVLSPEGGFVFAPIHNIQAKVPPENIITFFETAFAYGKY